MKKETKKRVGIFIEIGLLVVAVFAFSYILKQGTDKEINFAGKTENGIFRSIMGLIGKLLFNDKSIVSAASLVSTCVNSKDGSVCQEYASNECDGKCSEKCIPANRKDVAECKLGTCYDNSNGICALQSPKLECEKKSGKWFDDPNGNLDFCRKGCCILGGQTTFATKQQCQKTSELLGFDLNFKQDIKTEIGCFLLSKSSEDGACVFTSEFEKTCRFTTRDDCSKIKGDFHPGFLCSNPDLGTNCEKQKTTNCVNGKDEIYWFDSCGNRENIYDADREKSWNGGMILSKDNSCSLGTVGNSFANRVSCGNCDRIIGSVCGEKTGTESLTDVNQNYVCRDLRCVDDSGKLRENGESWCQYQGSIGIDATGKIDDKKGQRDLLRSVDPVGSRDFRKVCVDGEVRTEPCADYRNEICIESKAENNGKTFASAACRTNTWQECINYNLEIKGDDKATIQLKTIERDEKCQKNPDCFLNEVNLGEYFSFKTCAPKYPEGFDLQASGASGANDICKLATQKCVEVWVKDMGGSWNCVANCQCHTQKFTEQMNNLCISLGDCGTKANYNGDLTYNHRVFVSGGINNLGKDVTQDKMKLSESYISKIASYASYKNSPNEYINGENFDEFYASLNGLETHGSAQSPNDPTSQMTMISTLAGTGGILLKMGVGAGMKAGGLLSTTGSLGSVGPTLGAAGGVLAGAAIGFSVINMLLQLTKIGPALGSEGAYTLAGLGAAAGGVIGAVSIGGVGATAAGGSIGAGATLAGGSTIAAGTVTAGTVTVGTGAAATTVVGTAASPAIITTSLGTTTVTAGATTVTASAGAAGGATVGAGGATVGTGGAVAGTTGATTSAAAMVAAVAWVVIALVVIFIVVEKILGAGEMKKVVYTFQCQPWEPPNGGSKCEQCGKDGFPCGKYNCESLGQTCQFINEGTTSEACVNVNPHDVTPPVIKPLNSSLFNAISYYDISDYGYKIKTNGEDGCIKSYETITFGIKTEDGNGGDESSQCRFDISHTPNFDGMQFDFGQSSLFTVNHTQFFTMPSLDSLGIPGYDPERKADFNFYIRCQDKNGNKNEKEYVINLCVKPGRDVMSPMITAREPSTEYVAFEAKNISASVFTNEPSDCKWDLSDKSYSDMGNTFTCNNGLDQQELNGWRCSSILPVQKNDSSIYVRCLDQPWLAGINDSLRNAMQTSYEFNIKKSSGKLNIDYITPNNLTIKSKDEPISVKVEVKTSGGIDGKAECEYDSGNGTFVQFYNTFDVIHSQIFNQFTSGDKIINVKCEDLAGNVAEKNSSFKLEIDNNPPVVTRVYNNQGNLFVITNENAECSFIKTSPGCNFDFENGTLMQGSDLIHVTDFNKSASYYIKCKDDYDNVPGTCSIKVARGV